MKIHFLLVALLMIMASNCSYLQTEVDQESAKPKEKASTKRKLKKKKEELAPCICMEIYSPVCGKDGITYSNECMANCHKVRFEKGECPYN